MYQYAQKSCPICQTKFQEGNDVVVCPECGTPYHRDCYQRAGRCIYEDRHEEMRRKNEELAAQQQRIRRQEEALRQQQRQEGAPLRCRDCGSINPPQAVYCQVCGSPLDRASTAPGAGQHNPGNLASALMEEMFQGLGPEDQLGGEKVSHVAAYVRENSFYFLPRFKRFAERDGRVAWNWAAFFFSFAYYFYRKMYKAGTVLLLISVLVSVPNFLAAIGILRETLIAQGIAVSSFGADFNYVLISQLQWFSNVVTFAISLFLGLFTNRFYMGHVFRQIKALKARRSSLTDSQLGGVLKAHGGVSRGAVLVLAIVVFGLTFTASYFIVGLL